MKRPRFTRTDIEIRVAFAVPMPVRNGIDERDERNWFVRVKSPLPARWDRERVSALVAGEAVAAVHAACVERGFSVEVAQLHLPRIELVRVDVSHLLLRIATPRLAEDVAHAYLIAGSHALRALEKLVELDDIQGIPRRYWRHLIGG
ncbi:MAG: hypothetical protein U0271_21455 [Polyangiaceae bacterium]